jgi:hypothetical protein
MALLICEECKKEYSDKVEVCFHCGAPKSLSVNMVQPFNQFTPPINAKPPSQMKRLTLKNIVQSVILILLIVIGVKFWLYYYEDHSQSANSLEGAFSSSGTITQISDSTLPAHLESDYDDVSTPDIDMDKEYRHAIFGDFPKNKAVVFGGTVLQIIDGNSALVGTLVTGFMANGHKVVVNFSGKPQILEGDMIGIKGRYLDAVDYELSTDISKVQIPTIAVDFYSTSNLGEFFKKRIDADATTSK